MITYHLPEDTIGIEVGGNKVDFYIFDTRYLVTACPGENDCFEIILYRVLEDDSEESLVTITFPLTHEEWLIAMDSFMEDFAFEDSIDSLIAKRVAKGMLNLFLRQIREACYGNCAVLFDFDEYSKRWQKYLIYLINEKKEGRDISTYIPGYEPRTKK